MKKMLVSAALLHCRSQSYVFYDGNINKSSNFENLAHFALPILLRWWHFCSTKFAKILLAYLESQPCTIVEGGVTSPSTLGQHENSQLIEVNGLEVIGPARFTFISMA